MVKIPTAGMSSSGLEPPGMELAAAANMMLRNRNPPPKPISPMFAQNMVRGFTLFTTPVASLIQTVGLDKDVSIQPGLVDIRVNYSRPKASGLRAWAWLGEKLSWLVSTPDWVRTYFEVGTS